jgi:hypothetical protein
LPEAQVKPTIDDFMRISGEMMDYFMAKEAESGKGSASEEWFTRNFEGEFMEEFAKISVVRVMARVPDMVMGGPTEWIEWVVAMQLSSFSMGYEFGKQIHGGQDVSNDE